MNAQRREHFNQMLADAAIAGESDYRIFLMRDAFYKQAAVFLKGEDCDHTQALCDRVASNGRHMYFHFCCQCGKRLSKFLPHKSVFLNDKRGAYGGAHVDAMRAARSAAYGHLQDFYRAGWWGAYNAYLQSEHWQELRERVLYRDGYECQLQLQGCTRAATQVHHLTYQRVTREWMADLTSVCNGCHEQHHGKRFYEEPIPTEEY